MENLDIILSDLTIKQKLFQNTEEVNSNNDFF